MSAVKAAFPGSSSTPASAPGSSSPSSSHGAVTSSALQTAGAPFGWAGQQINDWMQIIKLEDPSGSLTATNPSSGAYGIAQGIDGPGWYYTHGGNPLTLLGQLKAMANYIRGRYGNPSTALQFHLANGWY
jgi:hypothetical protein